MVPCVICGKKAKRRCPVRDGSLCTACCGSQRSKESCPSSCEHLRGLDYQVARDVEWKALTTISEESDPFQMIDGAEYAHALEGFIVDEVGDDVAPTDREFEGIFARIYADRTGAGRAFEPRTPMEKMVADRVRQLDLLMPQIPPEMKNRVLLRIVRSARKMMQGPLSRNYMELIYSQHRPDGRFSDAF